MLHTNTPDFNSIDGESISLTSGVNYFENRLLYHKVREVLFGIDGKTITNNRLQAAWELHQPDMWIFSHYHKSQNEVLNGTRFICLTELEKMNL